MFFWQDNPTRYHGTERLAAPVWPAPLSPSRTGRDICTPNRPVAHPHSCCHHLLAFALLTFLIASSCTTAIRTSYSHLTQTINQTNKRTRKQWPGKNTCQEWMTSWSHHAPLFIQEQFSPTQLHIILPHPSLKYSNTGSSSYHAAYSGRYASTSPFNNPQDTTSRFETPYDLDAAEPSELDDYFAALMLQMRLIADDRDTGSLGKVVASSDTQVAIEHMLREAREMEQSYRLAKSLSLCETVPEDLIEELSEQDHQTWNDRELAERLERHDAGAELTLQATNASFRLVLQHFITTAECSACFSTKRTYIPPCGHPYCEDCAKSLFNHALSNRAFIPVRCCRTNFASDLTGACLTDTDDIVKYDSIKNEIEHPCPPAAELDAAASRLITEKNWKICARCGAVVERASGCVHMTCVCRFEFCYTCLKVWHSCSCELYPVAELNQILNERIGHDDPGQARHRLQNVLRNFYQHEHDWQREAALGRVCSVCDWRMPLYCLHCEVCLDTRCQRCCYNN